MPHLKIEYTDNLDAHAHLAPALHIDATPPGYEGKFSS